MFATFKKIISFLCWSLAGLVVCSVFAGLFALVVSLASSDKLDDLAEADNAVAVVELNGEILGVGEFRKNLRKHVESDSIKAIVVEINSPGGAVGAAEEMFRLIKWARETKPVVCTMGTVAASGGLYAALGCEKILVNRGTLTGSIGVILAMPNVGDVMTRFGVGMTIIKSGKYKDAGSPFRKLSADDQVLLQSVVDGAYEQFVDTIATERGLDVEQVKKFSDGRIILGEDAVNLGLVDEVGGLQLAGVRALELAGVAPKDGKLEPKFVFEEKREGLMKIFEGMSSAISNLISITSKQSPVLMYRLSF